MRPSDRISVVTALAGPNGDPDPQDLSTTGLGITIGFKPIPQDPMQVASVKYKISFQLWDGGNLFENYEVVVLLATNP